MRLDGYVRAMARRRPHATAVRDARDELTYAELDELADRQAVTLAASGVGVGDRVVLWVDKSVRAVSATQAVLRLGACYVPLTPMMPAARARYVAEACAAAAVVTDRDVDVGPVGVGRPVLALDSLESSAPASLPRHEGGPGDMAYVLYTSGSTGVPKGVCISHDNADAFVAWAGDLLGVSGEDRLSNHAPFNFDLSVFDLYAAFRAGASVTLVPTELSYAAAKLVELIHTERLTVWYSVPSVLMLMMRDGGLLDRPPTSLRACVFAGEPMPIGEIGRLAAALPGTRLFNWYGPTETNVCTSHEVAVADLDRDRPVPIGMAASGDEVTLDPPGGEGEIVVSGPTVMLGYWGGPPHQGPYHTGDIGRRTTDGSLELVGRIDDMVKIRGHRVELGEIEAVLTRHPRVSAVAVVVVGDGLEARLHAAVVPRAGCAQPRLLDVKRHCAELLPTYMIVDGLHVVDALPLTPNGKVDRSAIRARVKEVNDARRDAGDRARHRTG